MNKEDLQKLIGDEIQKVAHEYLKELSNQKKAQSTNDYINSKNISEEDFDNNFFYGGNNAREEKKKNTIIFKESTDSELKITTSEIKEFENSFGEILENIPGASIVFDKQNNGYSISATKRADGVEAKASGIINLGDNGKITFTYSILNGLNLNAQNLKLSESNKTMFEALYNHYNDWQKKWREKLNLPSSDQSTQDMNTQADTVNQAVAAQSPLGSEVPQPNAAPQPAAPLV